MTITDIRPAVETENPRGHDDIDGTDPDAPYGRRDDGTPKAKPGRKPGTPNSVPRARPAPVAAPQPRPRTKSSSGSSSRRRPPEADYRGGILGLVQLAAAPLVIAGAKSDAMMADAAAVTEHAPGIADALHALALERPEVAAALDRLLAVGPYGAILGAVFPLAVQVLANHNVVPMPVAAGLGAKPPQDLAAAMRTPQQAAA